MIFVGKNVYKQFVLKFSGLSFSLFFLLFIAIFVLPGAEEPGARGNRGGFWREPELAGRPHYSPAPVEVGYFLFTLLLPLVFKLWDLFM